MPQNESEFGTFKVVSRITGNTLGVMTAIKYQLTQARGLAELERAKGYEVVVSRLGTNFEWVVIDA